MLPIAQETSDYEANPFAVEQAKCDETIFDSCDKVHRVKRQQREKQADLQYPQDAILCPTNINLTLALLPSSQILVDLPEIHGYLACKGKQHKLVKPSNS